MKVLKSDVRIPALTTISGFTPNGSAMITAQNGVSLADISTRGTTDTLNVTANNGAIIGNGILDISVSTTLSATGNIALNNSSNNFNSVPVTINNGESVSLADTDNLTVNIAEDNARHLKILI